MKMPPQPPPPPVVLDQRIKGPTTTATTTKSALLATNLRLLRLDPSLLSSLTPTTFLVTANARLSDPILAFLLNAVDPVTAATALPATTVTAAAAGSVPARRDFRAAVHAQLDAIKPHLGWLVPYLRKSVLDEARGGRFVDILLALSAAAVRVRLRALDRAADTALTTVLSADESTSSALESLAADAAESYARVLEGSAANTRAAHSLAADVAAEIDRAAARVTEFAAQLHSDDHDAMPPTSVIREHVADMHRRLAAATASIATVPWTRARELVTAALDGRTDRAVISGVRLPPQQPQRQLDWTAVATETEAALREQQQNASGAVAVSGSDLERYRADIADTAALVAARSADLEAAVRDRRAALAAMQSCVPLPPPPRAASAWAARSIRPLVILPTPSLQNRRPVMLWCPTDHLSPPPPPPPPPLLYCDNDALLPLPSQQQQQQQRKRRRSEDSAADRLSPPPPHFKRPLHPASATEVGGRPIHQAPRLSVLRVSGDGRSAPLLPLPWDQPKRSRISGSGRRRVAASSHGLPPPPPPPPALHWVISPISAADSGLAASTMDFSPVTTTVTTAGPSAALSPRHSRHHRRPPRRLSYTLRTRPGSPLPDDEDVTEEVTMAQSMLDASGTIMADGVVQYGPLAMMPATPARGPSSPPTVPVVSERTRRDSIARALRSPGLSPAVREILTGGGSSVVHTKQVDARPTRRGQKSDEYAMAAADVSVDLDAMVGDGAVEDLRHATLDLGILLFEGE